MAVGIARACIRGGARGRFFNFVDLVNKLDAKARASRQGRTALESKMRTTAMIMLTLIAANFLNFVLASVGLANQLLGFIAAQELGPTESLLLVIAFYMVLGFFIETLSLMIVTIPFVTPLVAQLGFDPVWFGILLIVLIEMALITPPVGLNLYVVQGARGRGNLTDTAPTNL